MNKVAVYLRVSTEDQAKEGYSLEVQREYLESFAKRENLFFSEPMNVCEVSRCFRFYHDLPISAAPR